MRLNNTTPHTSYFDGDIKWSFVLHIIIIPRLHRIAGSQTIHQRENNLLICGFDIKIFHFSFLFTAELKVFNWNSIVHNLVTQTCTKAINLHNEITTKYLIAFQSTIQQFQTIELIIEGELKRQIQYF